MPSASSSAAEVASDAGSEAMARYMAHCPTAVKGAKAEIKDVPGGVEVGVTGPDDAAEKEIRERVARLIDASKADAGTVTHSGQGTGGGRFGHCTIVLKNTTLASADVPHGAKVSVKSKSADEVDWLRRETRDRDANSNAPGGDTQGQKRMAHCPSAIDSATTKVTNDKDGVVVTVTSKDPVAVADIRARAKHAAEVAKMPDAIKVSHSGQGTGGGGLGRCPIDVEGETTVSVKDVADGSEITVHAKEAAAVLELQRETKERAESFANKASPASSASAAPKK
jgi:TusA-related sulfurtransferase